MNKYGEAAAKAASVCADNPAITPNAAWEAATIEYFGAGTASQKKGCPKGAFLGLCEAGLVVGIPAGNYTRSLANKQYALDAVAFLRNSPSLAGNAEALWDTVLRGEAKRHNQQMHVVVALWQARLLIHQR